jgi:hypothetical protein
MLYAILCYSDEKKVRSLPKEQDDALMAKLTVVHEKLIADGKLGPHFRLMTTGSAKTLRGATDQVIDGPFAETKEQLLGLYLVDCASMEEAVETAHVLEVERKRAHVAGSLEVRPLLAYFEGKSLGG